MQQGDDRAALIYRTIGVWFGYAIAHYADFYDFDYLLIMGRVTSGPGGEMIMEESRRVLNKEFPEQSEKVKFHIPDEKEKRHGQAMAAASLPVLDDMS
jgi:predicted NBD/HSP70 family sugar kinase